MGLKRGLLKISAFVLMSIFIGRIAFVMLCIYILYIAWHLRPKEYVVDIEQERARALEQYLYKPSISYFVCDIYSGYIGFKKSIDETWWIKDGFAMKRHQIYRFFIVNQIFIDEYADLLPLMKQLIRSEDQYNISYHYMGQ
jgi:hypothetical protein